MSGDYSNWYTNNLGKCNKGRSSSNGRNLPASFFFDEEESIALWMEKEKRVTCLNKNFKLCI